MKFLRLFVIFFLSVHSSYGQFGMPPYQEVVTTFFSQYSFNGTETYIKFYRKKQGWFVGEELYTDQGVTVKSSLFWSKNTSSYQSLDYGPSVANNHEVDSLVSDYNFRMGWYNEQYNFERNRYYGYAGWDWDVINDPDPVRVITDSLLESKARAYSNYASGFIAEQFGDVFINNDPDRVPLNATEPIPASRVEKFIYYITKALDTYTALYKLNPEFITKVDHIRTKLANEYIFAYLEVLMAGDSTTARAFARKADYPDSVLMYARNYLAGLPENSILITGGDNDTYPLWYLQQIHQFRPDVVVLNNSLLGFRKYLQFLQRSSKTKLFTTTEEEYLSDQFELFVFGNGTNDEPEMAVHEFLSQLSKGVNPYDTLVQLYKGGPVKKYYTQSLYFENNGKTRSSSFRVGDYLFRNDFILLDLILHTADKRNIYFSFGSEYLMPLLVLQDYVYKLKLTQ